MFAGVDSHKDTLAVAVIDSTGRLVDRLQVANREAGFERLLELVTRHGVVRVGVEGSGNYGWPAALWLLEHRVAVVEVPPLLTARERSSRPGQGKTDPVDAVAIARITAREDELPPVRAMTGPAADLRVLAEYRDQLVAERTATANRVHVDLLWLHPGYQDQLRHLTTKADLKAAAALLGDDHSVRATVTRGRLARMEALTSQIGELRTQIDALVAASGSSLGQQPAADLRRRPAGRGHDHRAGRRRAPLPDPAPLRHRERHRPDPGLVGANRPAPAEPRRRSAAEPNDLHRRDHPDPRRHRRPRLLPTQTRRRKDRPRSLALPETAAVGPGLPHPPRRPDQGGGASAHRQRRRLTSQGRADARRPSRALREGWAVGAETQRGTTDGPEGEAAWQSFQPQPCSSLKRSTAPTTRDDIVARPTERASERASETTLT